jgi:hypothetical protein
LTVEQVDLGAVRLHPDNANDGNVEAVRDSLRRYGQWRPAVVQRSTGHVLIGNTMVRAMQAEGWHTLAVHWRDVGDDEAHRILAVDNRTRDLATYDERALVRLLDAIGADDLAGTGYDLDTYDDLRALVDEQDAAALRAMQHDADAGTPARPPSQVRTTPTHKDYLDAYDGKGTRHLALIYPVDVFVWLVERLERIADAEQVESNAEAVLRLVEIHTGDTAPPMPADDPAGQTIDA